MGQGEHASARMATPAKGERGFILCLRERKIEIAIHEGGRAVHRYVGLLYSEPMRIDEVQLGIEFPLDELFCDQAIAWRSETPQCCSKLIFGPR